MILQEIPLLPSAADQTLDITIDDVPYTLRVLWNERGGYFSLTISFRDGEEILTNVKMVNNFPLAKRYQRLDMAGDLYFLHKGGKTYRPTYDDLGVNYGLYYYDPETVEDLPVPITPRGSTSPIWDGGNSVWIDDGVVSEWV